MTIDLSPKFEQTSADTGGVEDLREKSVRGAFFMAASGAIEFLARIGGMLILARLLAPEDFGLVAMVAAFVGFFEVFKDLGLGVATIQRYEIANEGTSSLFWINAVFCGALTFGLWLSAPTISWFYDDSRLTVITLWLSTTLFLGGLTIQHEALLNRKLEQGKLAVIRLCATVTSLLVGVGLAYFDPTYWVLIAREVSRSLFWLIGVWLACGWIPALTLRIADVKEQLKFGRDITMTNVLMALVGKIDGVLIGKFFGPGVLGAYRQAYNLIMLPIEQFNGPVFRVAESGMSRLQMDRDRYARYFRRVAGYVSFVTMPLGIFTAIYAEELTTLILGPRWAAASPFVVIFALAAALLPTLATSALVLLTLGKSKALLSLAFSQSLVLVLAMVAGVRWGAVGVASANVITSLIFVVPRLYYGFKDSPITLQTFFSAIQMSLISTMLMGGGLACLQMTAPPMDSTTRLLLGGSSAIALYMLPRMLLVAGRIELRAMVSDLQGALFQRTLPNS